MLKEVYRSRYFFKEFDIAFKEMDTYLQKPVSVTTDGAPSMAGRKLCCDVSMVKRIPVMKSCFAKTKTHFARGSYPEIDGADTFNDLSVTDCRTDRNTCLYEESGGRKMKWRLIAGKLTRVIWSWED
ncbi:hypothetical protein TNCV_1409991 [Trichonephila clavipes]|nr:hypothetical protein TNCV_1409991 [Trichonephila clavipes]